MKNSFSYFENRDCKYYPCHDSEHINCLFCYCPLYRLECGGQYVQAGNIKDCSGCTWVHDAENYGEIVRILIDECGKTD